MSNNFSEVVMGRGEGISNMATKGQNKRQVEFVDDH